MILLIIYYDTKILHTNSNIFTQNIIIQKLNYKIKVSSMNKKNSAARMFRQLSPIKVVLLHRLFEQNSGKRFIDYFD